MRQTDPRQDDVFALRSSLATDIWSGVYPYAVCFLTDWLISALMYVLEKLFELLMRVAPIDGWPGRFISKLHSAGTVMAFALFVGLLLFDVIQIRRHQRTNDHVQH